jgi:hypothetical protein
MASHSIAVSNLPVPVRPGERFNFAKAQKYIVAGSTFVWTNIHPTVYRYESVKNTFFISAPGDYIYALTAGMVPVIGSGQMDIADLLRESRIYAPELFNYRDEMLKELCGPAAEIVVESDADKTIANIEKTANLEDEDESAPLPVVIEEISNLIRQASRLMTISMPEGVVSTFYGEINVTWRNGSDIVRLACFPNRSAILQFGNLSQPLGSYQSQVDPSAQDVAMRLDALNREAVR